MGRNTETQGERERERERGGGGGGGRRSETDMYDRNFERDCDRK